MTLYQGYSCPPCNLAFANEQAWQQHLFSPQHLSVVEAQLGVGGMAPAATSNPGLEAQLLQQQQQQQLLQQQLWQQQQQQQQHQQQQQQSMQSMAQFASSSSPLLLDPFLMAQLGLGGAEGLGGGLTLQDQLLLATLQQMEEIQQLALMQSLAGRQPGLRQPAVGLYGGLLDGQLLGLAPGANHESILGAAPNELLFNVGKPPSRSDTNGRLGSKFTVIKKPASGRSSSHHPAPDSRGDGCRNCGSPSHILRECPEELHCDRCGRTGHTRHVCRDAPDRGRERRDEGGSCRNCGSTSHGLRNCTQELECTRCGRTGHTHHICKEGPNRSSRRSQGRGDSFGRSSDHGPDPGESAASSSSNQPLTFGRSEASSVPFSFANPDARFMPLLPEDAYGTPPPPEEAPVWLKGSESIS